MTFLLAFLTAWCVILALGCWLEPKPKNRFRE